MTRLIYQTQRPCTGIPNRSAAPNLRIELSLSDGLFDVIHKPLTLSELLCTTPLTWTKLLLTKPLTLTDMLLMKPLTLLHPFLDADDPRDAISRGGGNNFAPFCWVRTYSFHDSLASHRTSLGMLPGSKYTTYQSFQQGCVFLKIIGVPKSER